MHAKLLQDSMCKAEAYWVIDAHATGSVEDSCGPDDHSRWPNEPALSKYGAKDHHCDNCCRVVLGLIWWVNDPAIDVAKDNAPACDILLFRPILYVCILSGWASLHIDEGLRARFRVPAFVVLPLST